MARSLDTRLKRLEDGAEPRAECGWDGDWSSVEIEVVWEDLDGEGSDEEDGPEYCPECGQQLVYTVTWKDLEDSAWE